MKENKGITLVALVITIIILIILAGITINMVLGEDGLIAKSKAGANDYKNAAADEQTMLGKINELFENNGSTGGNTPSGPTVADVTVSNYGQYVDLGTNILTKTVQLEDGTLPATDWRVFKKDDNGVWLILADYMPKEKVPSETGVKPHPDSSYLYSVYHSSERDGIITGLNSASWKSLISENTKLYNNPNVIVKGGFEIEKWIESWEDSGYVNINTALTETAMSDDKYGYYVYKDGESATSTNTSIKGTAGYGNTLYFPRKTYPGYCYGYWLASPSASSTDCIMYVDYSGYIHNDWYNHGRIGVRPAVFLPSSIKLDTSGAVWTIVE